MVAWETCKIPPWWSLVVSYLLTVWSRQGFPSWTQIQIQERIGSWVHAPACNSTINNQTQFREKQSIQFYSFLWGGRYWPSLSTCDRVGVLPKWLGVFLLFTLQNSFPLGPAKGGFPQGSLAPEGLRFQFQHALSVCCRFCERFCSLRKWRSIDVFYYIGPCRNTGKSSGQYRFIGCPS